MELRVLQYFLAIAREESFTKAAQQLHVTQPTLSRQIAQLEEELGVELFVRSKHHIFLTADGMMLQRRAQEILSLADKTKRDFLHKTQELEGVVLIGSGEFLSTRCLTECIAAFSQLYALVRFEIYSGNAGTIRDKIECGLLDLGLIAEPVVSQKYQWISMPVQEQWGALVPAGSSLAQKDCITPSDLVGIPVISAMGEMAESRIGKWLGEYSREVSIIAKGNLLYNEAVLAQSTLGAVIGIRLHCQYDGLRFVPLFPSLTSSTALVWKKEQVFSAAAASFIDFAKEYLKSMAAHKI